VADVATAAPRTSNGPRGAEHGHGLADGGIDAKAAIPKGVLNRRPSHHGLLGTVESTQRYE